VELLQHSLRRLDRLCCRGQARHRSRVRRFHPELEVLRIGRESAGLEHLAYTRGGEDARDGRVCELQLAKAWLLGLISRVPKQLLENTHIL